MVGVGSSCRAKFRKVYPVFFVSIVVHSRSELGAAFPRLWKAPASVAAGRFTGGAASAGSETKSARDGAALSLLLSGERASGATELATERDQLLAHASDGQPFCFMEMVDFADVGAELVGDLLRSIEQIVGDRFFLRRASASRLPLIFLLSAGLFRRPLRDDFGLLCISCLCGTLFDGVAIITSALTRFLDLMMDTLLDGVAQVCALEVSEDRDDAKIRGFKKSQRISSANFPANFYSALLLGRPTGSPIQRNLIPNPPHARH